MITIYEPGWPPLRKCVFAKQPRSPFNFLQTFIQTPYNKSIWGYKKITRYTKIVDLTQNVEEITSNIEKNTLYEIRRSEKEFVSFIPDFKDYKFFINFFNDFALNKGVLKTLKNEFIELNKDVFIATACALNGEILAMHSYLIDHEIKRVILYHSASHFRDTDIKGNKALIGRANRYLHFADIKYFKERGFTIYDFGGYALNSTNESLININKFKDGFGGVLLEEYNYEPMLLVLIKWILGRLKK